jgi:serine phosphatase RsbU (regulator of sigma subunit)
MQLAAEIQWSLLPPLTFASPEVTIAAGLEPAYQVAGDSIDYAVDHGIARLAVFDGMGHGLASAQLVSLVVNAYRNARRADLSLVETVKHIDDAVTEIFAGASFCTGVLAELNTDTGELHWVSVGHPEPLLLREGRLVRSLHTKPVLPFGLAFDLPGAQRTPVVGVEHLQPEDLLLLYTDGITEARAPDGTFFGVDRLVNLVTRNLAAELPAPETLRRVIHALLIHQGHALDDDASLLMVHWRSGTESQLLPHP